MAAFPPVYWFSPHPVSEAEATGAATFFSVTRPAYQEAASTKALSSMCSVPSSEAGWVAEYAIGNDIHW